MRFFITATNSKSTMTHIYMQYWNGNPTAKLRNGTIFFKELKKNPDLQHLNDYLQFLRQTNQHNSECMAMVAIPDCKDPVQMITQIRNCIRHIDIIDIQQLKVVKNQYPGYYSILIKFAEEKDSTQFYNAYFGKTFNSVQIYRIILRDIQSFTVHTQEPNFLTFLTHTKQTIVSDKLQPQYIFESYPLSLESAVYNAQFLCYICKKEMLPQQKQIKSGGIIIILCSHYYHSNCLENNPTDHCISCKYPISTQLIPYCYYCAEYQNNWLCTTCNEVFCSSRTKLHRQMHLLQTEHNQFVQMKSKKKHKITLNKQKILKDKFENNTFMRLFDVQKQINQRMKSQSQKYEKEENQKWAVHKSKIISYAKQHKELKKEVGSIKFQSNFRVLEDQIKQIENQRQIQLKAYNLLSGRMSLFVDIDKKVYENQQQIKQKQAKLTQLQSKLGRPPKIDNEYFRRLSQKRKQHTLD